MTDTEVITAWLASKNPSTQRVYAPVSATFAATVEKPLATVTRADATNWIAQWATQEAATRARKIRTLRSLYRFGQAYAGWPTNPFLSIQDPAIPERLALRMPTADEVWTLMEAAKTAGPRTFALIAFVFGTACRISEVVAATWGSIAIETPDTHWLWMVPHRRPPITIPLRPEVITALRQWREAQRLDPNRWSADDATPIFPDAHGQPSNPITLTATIRRLAARIGLPHAVPAYGLRHAHAGLALKNGASLGLVQRTLGHRFARSTARYLGVVSPPASSADALPWGRSP